MLKYSHVVSFFFLTSFLLRAQTGPGGVGDQSTNVLWVKADDLSGLNDGDDITTWTDVSGNNNDLSQPNASFKPIYKTNIVNGFPVVRFNKSNGRLRKNPFNSFPSTAATSIFVNINNGESGDALLSYASTGHNNNYLIFSSSSLNLYRNSNRNTGVDINNNVWNIVSIGWRRSGGIVEGWKNGDIDHRSTGFATSGSITANGSLALAGEQDAVDGAYVASQAHFGDFPEVIMYNYFLDTTEQIIVSNYLSAKYNIVLVANDVYDEDDVINGDFDFDVAGIGRKSATAFNDDAQGSGIVRVLNPTDLGNDEYMMWGHNNMDAQAGEYTDVPAGVEARFNRVWRLSEVSILGAAVDVGAVDMRWDLSDFLSVTAADLRLLVDTDNDGLFNDESPISGATDLGGGIFEFSGVSALANNLRFTIATANATVTPLPIELLYFIAEPLNDNTVNLRWATASEINNDYFTIEHSVDHENWDVLTQVKAKGESHQTEVYHFIDRSPLSGINYYRLTQTDYDGTPTFLSVQSVAWPNLSQPNRILFYPNPSQAILTIQGEPNVIEAIKLYNIHGQEIHYSNLVDSQTAIELKIDVSTLPSGIYFIKTPYEVRHLVIGG